VVIEKPLKYEGLPSVWDVVSSPEILDSVVEIDSGEFVIGSCKVVVIFEEDGLYVKVVVTGNTISMVFSMILLLIGDKLLIT